MPTFRDFLEPGGKILAHRLDQLCATLESLGTQLRGTIVNAIGETIGGIVRDTAFRVLDEATQYLPGHDPGFSAPSSPAPGPLARETLGPQERDYWGDEYEDRHESDPEDPPPSTPPERLPSALSAGLQAASWWLRRWSGHSRALTTLAVGLFTTGLAFLGGPLVVAALGLAETAMQFYEFYLAVARLGGHMNRKADGFPGWLTLWRGWQKLENMVAGVEIDRQRRKGKRVER